MVLVYNQHLFIYFCLRAIIKIMKNTTNYIIIIVLLLLLTVAFIYAFGFIKQDKRIRELQAVEVKEYEGKDLSSIGDFRENSIKGPQYIDRNDYSLKIHGLIDSELNYSYDDIINNFQNYKKVVTLNCVEGWSVTILWEGVLVKDLINKEKISEGANTIIFRAVDGYSTSFPLEYIMNNDIIMAFKMNDVEIPPERGFPFQLVAESKYGYKWIKWITEIEISDDEDYKGYWESRGYSNDGDLDKRFLGN